MFTDMRLRSGPSRRAGQTYQNDARSGDAVLQGARDSDGRSSLFCRRRRLERRVYIRRTPWPKNPVPGPEPRPSGMIIISVLSNCC